MKQPSGNISAVYQYRCGEKSSVLQNNAQRQNSRSQSQTLFLDNKAEMPEEHLDRSLSRLQSLYNFVINHGPIVFFIYQSIIKCNRVQNMSKQHRSNRSMLTCSCCWTVDWVLLEPLMAAQRLWWPSTVFWSSVSWRACWTSWSRICSKHSCPQSPTSGWTEAFRPASDTL